MKYFWVLFLIFYTSIILISDEIKSDISLYLKLDKTERESKFSNLRSKIYKLKIEDRITNLKYLEENYPEKNTITYLKILSAIANQYIFTNDENLFNFYSNKSQNVAISNNFFEELINSYLLKSQNFKIHNSFDSALYYCLISEEIANKNNIKRQFSEVYHLMGDIYYHLELKDIAEKYYLKIIDNHNDNVEWIEWQKIVIYTNLGNIYTTFRNYEKAKNCYNIAINQLFANKMANTSMNSDEQLAHIYKRVAEFFYDQNSNDSAKYYIENSIELLEKDNREVFQPGIYFTAAKIFLLTNESKKAEYYLNKASKLLDTNNIKGMRDYYFNLARLEYYNGKYQTAYDKLYKSYELNINFFNKNNSAQILEPKILRDFDKLNNEISKNKILNYIYLGLALILALIASIIIIYNRKLSKSYKLVVQKTLQMIEQEEKQIQFETISPEIPEIENDTEEIKENLSNDISESEIIENDKFEEDETINEKDTHNVNLSPEFIKLAKDINNLLENSDIIFNPDFGIIDLTNIIKTNRTYISKAINGYFGKTFQIYINELRIKALIKLLAVQNNRYYKLDILMHQVGFTNRATFIKSFQKYTGITPSNFIKNFKIENKV